MVCKRNLKKKKIKNRECSNLVFFTASHLLISLSVHLNFVPLTLEDASWLGRIHGFVFPAMWLVERDERRFVISSTWKQSRFSRQSKQLCSGEKTKNLKWCLLREGQGFAQNITGKRKRVPQIREAATWVRAYFFPEIGRRSATAMFALEQALVTADFIN